MDGKIYIYVTSKDPNVQDPEAVQDTQPTNEEKESSVGKYIRHQFYSFVSSEVKSNLSFVANNIGNFTGNYIAGRAVKQVVSPLLNFAWNVGISAAIGFKYGGAPGAIIAAAASTATQIINFFEQESVNMLMFNRQQRNIDILKDRSGLYQLNNNNRTGEY